MPQSGKLPVLNLLRPKSGYSPPQGRLVAPIQVQLARASTLVNLAVQNFTSIGAGGENAAQKYQKFPLLGSRLIDH